MSRSRRLVAPCLALCFGAALLAPPPPAAEIGSVLGAPAMNRGATTASLDLANQDRTPLSVDGLGARRPQVAVAVDGATATVHVLWEQMSAYILGQYDVVHRYRRFDTSSGTWLDPRWSDEQLVQMGAESASLAAHGNRVFAAYELPAYYFGDVPTIRLMQFEAVAWSEEMTVTPGDHVDLAAEGTQPTLSIDPAYPNRLWLAWINNGGNQRRAQAARLVIDGGARTVELSGPIDSGIDEAQSPAIDADYESEGSVWAAWSTHDSADGQDRGYVWRAEHQREDNALSWKGTRHLNAGRRGSGPRIVVSTDDVCIAWQERIGEGPAKPDILVDCMSSAKQHNFSDTEAVVSSAPVLAFGEGVGALLAWQEGDPDHTVDFRTGPPPSEDTHEVDAGIARSPHLAYDGVRSVHSVYVRGTGAEANVYYTRIDGVAPPPTPTAVPTVPTATETPTPAPTATPRPSTTPSPTLVPSATPSPTITPTGTRPTPTTEPTATPGPRTPTATSTVTVTPDRPQHLIYIPYTKKPRTREVE